ncbi:MAG: hypothetical protein IIZ39_08395 [Blautia sp.]|nr:hypothetical protein [Blautia sp.]
MEPVKTGAQMKPVKTGAQMKGACMKKIRFNQGWQFQAGDGDAFSALFGGAPSLTPVTLPHDHLIEIPRNP